MNTKNRNHRGVHHSPWRRLTVARPVRRSAASTWKEQARTALNRAPIAPVNTTSALRQPKQWHVRAEPRNVCLVPRAENRTAEARPRTRYNWEWWQVLVPVAIATGAIIQLVQSVR